MGAISKSAPKKASTSTKSKTSSQRQKELLLAMQRREELKKQTQKAIRLPKQMKAIQLKQLEQQEHVRKKKRYS